MTRVSSGALPLLDSQLCPLFPHRGGSFLFTGIMIKAQPAGRLSLPGPGAVLVKQLKAGPCHTE